jgi:hypothetical protein
MRERRDIFEMFILSKIWFIAQILPLPQAVAARAISWWALSCGGAILRGWPSRS